MKQRGAVTLVFDDGYTAVYNAVVPLLHLYGIRAVFAVPLHVPDNTIEGETLTSTQKWLAIAAEDGHEIAAHGITHTDLTKLSDAELDQELQEPANILQAPTLIYPGGAYDDRVINAAKQHYKAARTVQYGLNDLHPKDPLQLKTINFTKNNFSVARANIHALRAYLKNKWLIETYHMVSKERSSLTHSAVIDDLEAHLDFITSVPVRITTIRDIV